MPSECDLCQKPIQEFNSDLVGGKCLKFQDDSGEYYVTRCDACFEKDKSLRNYKKTEVYSRVCGYIRPTNQWNKGKQEEYNERVVFVDPNEDTEGVEGDLTSEEQKQE